MLDSHFFTDAMNEIDVAQKKGFLITPQACIKQTGAHSEYRQLTEGKTTHPYFDRVDRPYMTYRVKANISASDAIESLLNSHQTLVDCGVTMAILYNLAILRMMESKFGKDIGRKRFDEIFGQKESATPLQRRLIISPFSLLMGTELLPNIGLLPVQPLSYFAEMKFVGNKNQIESAARIGWQLIFGGDPNYMKLHPAGEFAAYNCVVTSVNPIKVRSSDIPGIELVEEDIVQHHIAAYAEAPSYESFCMQQPAYRNSMEYISFSKIPTTKSKIEGFTIGMFALNEERLHFLLTEPVEKVIAALHVHIQEMEQRCLSQKYGSVRNAFEKEVQRSLSMLSLSTSSNHSATSDNKPIQDDYLSGLSAGFAKAFASKPNAAASTSSTTTLEPQKAEIKQLSESTFGGLKGLVGAYVKPGTATSDKPANAATNQGAAKKEDFMPGLKKGFFNK